MSSDEPRTLDLNALRGFAHTVRTDPYGNRRATAVSSLARDVPVLCAEVERLRDALNGLNLRRAQDAGRHSVEVERLIGERDQLRALLAHIDVWWSGVVVPVDTEEEILKADTAAALCAARDVRVSESETGER